MATFVKNGYAVLAPEKPAAFRANCASDWGLFVEGDTNKMSSREAEKAGLTYGEYVEMAVCWLSKKVLTFEPNYYNEEFLEIWGIPTAGELKDKWAEKASILSTFLMHRQSKDKFEEVIAEFEKTAFNTWLEEGANGDPNDYINEVKNSFFFTKIFRFEMTKAESDYGIYHYVKTTFRDPDLDSELELAMLDIARQIYEGQLNGLQYCYNARLELNHEKNIAALQSAQQTNGQTATIEASTSTKQLTGK